MADIFTDPERVDEVRVMGMLTVMVSVSLLIRTRHPCWLMVMTR